MDEISQKDHDSSVSLTSADSECKLIGRRKKTKDGWDEDGRKTQAGTSKQEYDNH